VPLEAGQAITVELADAKALVVDEGLCMRKLPLVDPDSNSDGDEAIEVPEGLIGVLELDIEVPRLKTVLALDVGNGLLDMFGMVLEVDKMPLSVEVVGITEVNVREAEDELEAGLLGIEIICAPQTLVFELAAPTEDFM
jgi:hypothetical protein